MIYDAIQSLRPMPHRGRLGRIESTRELVLSNLPYIVVYRVFDERLLILNIIHGAQALAVDRSAARSYRLRGRDSLEKP